MNKNVSYQQAKLLKEKGFDENCESWAYLDDNCMSMTYDSKTCVKVPTIADVVSWLYEKHGIWISVDTDINGKFRHIIRKYNSIDRAWEVKNPSSIQDYFNNPDDAYSSGITYFLNNL